ncbi:HypC/HybG/HupF family hydrogenase formation chaperone [Paracraurococcus lichenis]|uniref:HypC/HybG/HupF family hydrogenase formation chaperone n=1 Tax=Paracraurococcus lichenis TaxID=3064888 RepID=A0ABT9DZJ2_9PROT|nr:HypC/HybG/HupF family hydrogenase formation chaperone [Paracraurococcus sp. LOR1-02]MDO9709328.1 HypC/HybG/HupF family hydrogenase formation chaperone [Paracraurococcus sp. LOR1-02]
MGIPMQVLDGAADPAPCATRDGREEGVSMLLLGPQPAGTWVLVHLGTAMRALEAAEAAQIADALEGLAAGLEGRPFEHLFADLIGRAPELPPHLRPETPA